MYRLSLTPSCAHVEQRSIAATIASFAGAWWIGKTVGEWVFWLYDRRLALEMQIETLREQLQVAEAEFAALDEQQRVAESEDPNTIIGP